jgi:hypothetical protein
MAVPHHIPADIGTTVRRTFTWSRKVNNAKVRVNLTGATAHMVVAKRHGDTPLFVLDEGDGITLGGVAGTILVLITPAMWPNPRADVGSYLYDLVVTLADATVVKLVEGRFIVHETIST